MANEQKRGETSPPRPGAASEVQMFMLEGFEGLNTQSPRSAIGEQQLSWSVNIMPIGPGNARSLYSNGATIYTSSGGLTIICFYHFNISDTNYIAVFLSDGTADQVNIDTLVVTHITLSPGGFYNGTSLPRIAQYGEAGIIIIAKYAAGAGGNGYFAWDGALLSTPGTPSPTWLNGGTPTTMPFSLSGNEIVVYQNRVWTIFGPFVTFSAPGNGALYGTGGGGSFQSTDSFLRSSFIAALQSSGFLYLFGDSSINVISNVQTSGSPAITTFSNNNIDPQISTPWPGTVQAFGREILFANTSGVYSLFGGTVKKISNELNGVFEGADFSHLVPTAAVATIFGILCYCIVIDSFDPISQTNKFQMFCWEGKKWFPATQDAQVQMLTTQEIKSNLTAVASDGTHIFNAFQVPSNTLSKVAQSKLWAGRRGYITNKQVNRVYAQAFDAAGAGVELSIEIDAETLSAVATLDLGSPINFVNNIGGVIQFQNNSSGNIFFQSSSLAVRGKDASAYGLLLGMTISTFSPDFTLVSVGLMYQEYAPYG